MEKGSQLSCKVNVVVPIFKISMVVPIFKISVIVPIFEGKREAMTYGL